MRDVIDVMISTLEKIRDEDQKAEKLRIEQLEQLANDRAVMLANVLAMLRKVPNVNGTVAEDIRRQRNAIENHLRSTAA